MILLAKLVRITYDFEMLELYNILIGYDCVLQSLFLEHPRDVLLYPIPNVALQPKCLYCPATAQCSVQHRTYAGLNITKTVRHIVYLPTITTA